MRTPILSALNVRKPFIVRIWVLVAPKVPRFLPLFIPGEYTSVKRRTMAADDFLFTMRCNFRIRFDDAEPSQMETEDVTADSIMAVYSLTGWLNCRGKVPEWVHAPLHLLRLFLPVFLSCCMMVSSYGMSCCNRCLSARQHSWKIYRGAATRFRTY